MNNTTVHEDRADGTPKHIIPDIILFVNGILLVVVECKSPTIPEPIQGASPSCDAATTVTPNSPRGATASSPTISA